MDYEKKYNDALERLRAFHRDYDNISTLVDVKELLEKIFPELRESEDEQTRKDLRDFILNRAGYLLDENTEHRFIAYLEKQKEQKQEWSGVDDLRLNQTINVCDRNGYPVLSKWLKGLSRRVTPQPSCNPAWRIWRNGACGNSDGNPIALVKESCGYKLVSCLGADGEKYIMLSDLEKLPGFNEK